MRSIEHIRFRGEELVGTYHHENPASLRRIGVLLLNAGYVPRDGHAGLGVKICDALAAQGFPSFRFDLPTLGDSSGEPPVQANELFDMVYRGDFAEPTLAILRELAKRHDLEGFILGGLCGAAVTAIYTADRDPKSVVGLILLEPELYRVTDNATLEPKTETTAATTPLERARGLAHESAGRLLSYWGWMRALTLENRFGRFIPLPRQWILDLVLSRDELPKVTNMPLVGAFRRVVDQRIPMLVITAQGKLRELFFDRITGVVLAGAETQPMKHVRLPGTNHIFTSGGAIAAVTKEILSWATRF